METAEPGLSSGAFRSPEQRPPVRRVAACATSRIAGRGALSRDVVDRLDVPVVTERTVRDLGRLRC